MESKYLLNSGSLLSRDCQSHSFSFCVCGVVHEWKERSHSARMLCPFCLFYLFNNLIYTLALNFKSQLHYQQLSPPYTSLAKFISRPHENTVESDERTNPLVCSKSNRRMLYCQDKGKIPHEASLLFGH